MLIMNIIFIDVTPSGGYYGGGGGGPSSGNGNPGGPSGSGGGGSSYLQLLVNYTNSETPVSCNAVGVSSPYSGGTGYGAGQCCTGGHDGYVVIVPLRVPTVTYQPSSSPSCQPSRQPSRRPSFQPSGKPSSYPSSQPTIHPSRQPSIQPSKQPIRYYVVKFQLNSSNSYIL